MWIIITAILLLLVWMVKLAFENNVLVKEFHLTIDKEITCFFISDIHRRKIHRNLIDKIRNHPIDFILLGGDLAEEGVSLEKIEANIQKLVAIAPTYFVLGNNDYEINYQQLEQVLQKHHVTILNNQLERITLKNQVVQIIGLDEILHSRQKLQKCLVNLKESDISILLCHNPIILDYIQENDAFDFIFCGHTHGGQIRVGPLGLYKNGGWEKFKNKQVLISNGYGTTLLPLRLGAKVQTHVIKFRNLK